MTIFIPYTVDSSGAVALWPSYWHEDRAVAFGAAKDLARSNRGTPGVKTFREVDEEAKTDPHAAPVEFCAKEGTLR